MIVEYLGQKPSQIFCAMMDTRPQRSRRPNWIGNLVAAKPEGGISDLRKLSENLGTARPQLQSTKNCTNTPLVGKSNCCSTIEKEC